MDLQFALVDYSDRSEVVRYALNDTANPDHLAGWAYSFDSICSDIDVPDGTEMIAAIASASPAGTTSATAIPKIQPAANGSMHRVVMPITRDVFCSSPRQQADFAVVQSAQSNALLRTNGIKPVALAISKSEVDQSKLQHIPEK